MRKYLFYSIAVVAISGSILTGCGKDDANPGICLPITDLCANEDIETCCTDTKCHYLYNGKKYYCDGTDCTAAAEQVVADACGNTRLDQTEFDNEVFKLLKAQRSIVN